MSSSSASAGDKRSPFRGGFPAHTTIELLDEMSWECLLRHELRGGLISPVRDGNTLIRPPNVVALYDPHIREGDSRVHEENMIGLNSTAFQQPGQMFGNATIEAKREVDGLQDQNRLDVRIKLFASRQLRGTSSRRPGAGPRRTGPPVRPASRRKERGIPPLSAAGLRRLTVPA